MDKKTLIFLLIFSIGIAAILINIYLPVRDKLAMSTDMHLTVGNKVGLNADNDALWFGIIPPRGTGIRPINIAADETGKYVVKLRGELAEWVTVSENSFTLEKGANKTISVHANVPANTEFRDYNGTLEVYFRKV